MVTNLVNFLLFKYYMKELVSKAEILNIIKSCNCYSQVFSEASECMQLIFGIDLRDVDNLGHTYDLVTCLGISYDGMSSKVQGFPKTGLLILILSIIFLQDDSVPEEDIWQTLNVMGIWAGMEHFIYGEPRRLILEDFVQEQYLVYWQVPNSEPARYEFVWGPRAHAETSKMKVLKFLASISKADPRSFGERYEEALRDEDQRALSTFMATTLADASSSASGGF
ncbi:melanoma-associated antigen 10 [Fukomys damarensis]|nr:melanoma-associated antigen 10 [Fukomys damarensis]